MVQDDEVIVETTGDPSLTHGQRLPDELRQALTAAGAAIADVDLLAVAAGPGSFTGLRVGIATMQGLASARDLRIFPASTLDALSHHAPEGSTALIGSWVDAQRGEVFSALYEAGPGAIVHRPTAAPPGDTLAAWLPAIGTRPVLFTGDGALRYRGVIRESLGEQASVLEPLPLLAGTIGLLAARNPGAAVVPHAVVPIYIRRPDAELARARRDASARRERP